MAARTLTWGFGLEHETHLFHVSKTQKTSIDSVILSDTLPIVQRILEKMEHDLDPVTSDILTRTFKAYEYSGRKCGPTWVLPRIKDIKMPEFITTEPFSTPKNKKIMVDYFNELIMVEETFVRKLQEHDKEFAEHIRRYGNVTNYITGMTSHIRVADDYSKRVLTFDKKRYLDYTGSYHLTITLPFNESTTERKFIAAHQNFANQFQWLEPLMLTAFFSCDDREPGSLKKLVRGSYRVMRIGWGNFAGTDVRRLADGIGRFTNIKNKWRDHPGLRDFDEIEKVNECKKYKKDDEPGSLSLMSSNIRTFGSTDPLRPQHRESGAGMNKPNGVELRIFDNFDIMNLYELCKLVVFIAENSRRHKATKYVYDNKGWIETLAQIMQHGWRASVADEYLADLRQQLGIPLNAPSKQAYEVFKTVADELYKKNVDGAWTKLMLGRFVKSPIKLPEWNRTSWDLGFMMKCNGERLTYALYSSLLEKLALNGITEITPEIFQQYFDKTLGAKRGWKKNVLDVYYFLCGVKRPVIVDGRVNGVNLSFHLRQKNFNINILNLLYKNHSELTIFLCQMLKHIVKGLSQGGGTMTKNELLVAIDKYKKEYLRKKDSSPNFYMKIKIINNDNQSILNILLKHFITKTGNKYKILSRKNLFQRLDEMIKACFLPTE